MLLYYKQLFGAPIISDNRLPLLTENIFHTPPFIWTTIYCYLGYLLDPLPSPIIWNWRVQDLSFVVSADESCEQFFALKVTLTNFMTKTMKICCRFVIPIYTWSYQCIFISRYSLPSSSLQIATSQVLHLKVVVIHLKVTVYYIESIVVYPGALRCWYT